MAKVAEELIVIKVSQLVKDSQDAEQKVTDTLISDLEGIVGELVGEGCVTEVIKGTEE